jgi:hypothetical protein
MRKLPNISALHMLIAIPLGAAAIGAFALMRGAPFPALGGSAAAVITSPFFYSFSADGRLQEAGFQARSTSPYWWLNSGAYLMLDGGRGMTVQGDLPAGDPWRKRYAAANPVDTDQGAHPQNLFRLVTRRSWGDVREQAQFYVTKSNFSASPNRNASNGLLLMSRYQDGGQTLYYAGVRVDGTAVIKKKYKGAYYTMAQEKIFPGTYAGEREDANLIPSGEWIGLRSETVTNEGGTVTVRLYMQRAGGAWEEILRATDTGRNFGPNTITRPGYAGIRTDFMDVKFESFTAENL